jgi:thiosulfate/3-mercaptopyruvate sulfurtransferase
MKRILSLAVLALPLLAAGAHEAPADEALRERGKTLYGTYCARCHGDDGADTTTYPGAKSLVGITRRLPQREVIEKSRGFAAVALDDAQAAALYAHLETLQPAGYVNRDLLAETDWLARHTADPKVRILDMRPEAAYAAGHIPGAVRLEEGPLRSQEDRLTYLPRPENFAAMMSKAGVSADTRVVAYDDQGGRMAARLWYVLNAFGHERVSVLNGGWTKWTAEKRPVSTEVPVVAPTHFTPKETPAMSCPSTEVLARRPNVVVLDARSAAEYTGQQQSGGAKQAGRIPGAVNVDWRENVTGPNQVFKPAAELRKVYEAKGVTPDREVIVY